MILIRYLLLTLFCASTMQGMQECGVCLEIKKTYTLSCCDQKQFVCKGCFNDWKKKADRTPTFLEEAYQTKPEYSCPFCKKSWENGADLQYISQYKKDLEDSLLKSKHTVLLSKLSLVLSATSMIAVLAKMYYQGSRNARLILLEAALKHSKSQLLSFDFEQFDLALAHNPLTHAHNLEQLCSVVGDTNLRDRLRNSISEYEHAYSAAYAKIIANYIYKPAIDFQEHEPQLVANLEHAAAHLQGLLTECKKGNALSGTDYFLITGGVVLAAISGYVATIAPNKMVDWLGDLL